MAQKPRIYFLLFILMVISSHMLFAQEQEQALESGNNKTSEQFLQEQTPLLPKELPSKTVTAIEIQGNKSISSNTIIAKMKVKIGSLYQENIVNDDLKRLYLLGFFSDIKIDTQDYKEGLKIVIIVKERPVIEKINFSGVKHLRTKDDKLMQSLKSKEGQYLDYPNLGDDVLILKKMYEKKGFSQAQINYTTDINEKTNKVKITFTAIENKRLRIKNIFVEGNKAFNDARILKLIKTKRAWLFNKGILKEDVLKEDIERIKTFYRKNGFADAASEYKINTDAKKPFLYITWNIQEGIKYVIGKVDIRGNKNISEKDILDRMKQALSGKIFSHEAVKLDVGNIQGLYFDRGYISAQVQEITALQPDTNRVNVVYNITENEITYVNKIKIKGNIKTRDLVIRRELRLKPGDRFDGEKLRRSKERLNNLGFFEDISYDTEDTSVSDKKDLIVDVKETKTGAFSFGGGYSTVDKLIGFFEIEQKNFDWKNFPYFTGAGQNLKFRASFGSLTESFDLSFTEPWLFDYPVSFGFDVYKRSHQRDTDVGYGYDEDVSGGDLRLGKEISEYVKANATYRYENIKIDNVTDTASSDLKDEAGKNKISSMEFGLSFDNRDNVFDATKGDLLSGSWLVAGGPLGGDKDFWKFYGRASHYLPLFLSSVLELRGRLGLVDTYGNSTKVPIYERLFVGGASTVRGYRERKIGPIDISSGDPKGGKSLLVGNLEYSYPLVNFIKLAIFYDIGNVWETTADLGSGDFKAGYGFGLRIKTPIGPIVLDYGIPLDKESGKDTKDNGRFHFSMSHGF